ncbi:MAG: DUF1501 domain-containing protein [Planctomycetes bacterium]|nr:DUF1501 domain-containing protein [Planctomycetota bacterium]
MITMLGSPRRCCDGLTRRETLKVGALALLGGFNLPRLLALEANGSGHVRRGKAKSVVLLYLLGGAATQDMFDLKPNAPVGVRSEFKPIATNVPGIQVCEHLPLLSRWMHRSAMVRTVNHRAACHNPLPSFSGYDAPLPDNFPRDTYPPSMGSVCEYLKKDQGDLPAYVCLPNYPGWGLSTRLVGPYAGFLGRQNDPLFSECRPSLDPDARRDAQAHSPLWRGRPFLGDLALPPDLTLDRLDQRRSLLQQFDAQQRRAEASRSLDNFDRTRARAYRMLTGSRLKAGFDLDREDPRLLDRYGRSLFGSSALVARKLVQAGVRFATVVWDAYQYVSDFKGNDQCWDTHAHNFEALRRVNLPVLDQTFNALMGDLENRGLLDETLVVVMSDFGRTHYINQDAGRDHWTYCYSVLLAGAGIRGGTVYGTSDAQAAFVKENPVRPADICATIYHCLGIDPDMLVPDRSGRPHPVANGGRLIREILT